MQSRATQVTRGGPRGGTRDGLMVTASISQSLTRGSEGAATLAEVPTTRAGIREPWYPHCFRNLCSQMTKLTKEAQPRPASSNTGPTGYNGTAPSASNTTRILKDAKFVI
ncbi:hypothetical protein E2C01_028971 [Portunus trituberculatus]|uniref:Uncharacterized protein n=1 Tax=Portunus trituberculatus TaxID=210409 RepID=A0A5B7EQP8_PORTR|nr:hypothetical protein [Portunus trituberculatus]